MFKNTIAKILTFVLITAIVIPSSIIARPFTTDPDLRVYPDNEIIYFQDTKVGESRTEQFTIENVSNSQKTVTVTSTPTLPFSYDSSTVLDITGNSTRSLAVSFRPNRTGYFESTMTIQNRATSETKILTIRGNAIDKDQNLGVEVSRSSLDFPRTIIGEVAEATVTITNRNNFSVNLTHKFQERDGQFSINLSNNTQLLPQQSIQARIQFRPYQSDDVDDRLTITANSDNFEKKSTSIKLRAEGITPVNPSNPDFEIGSSRVIDFGTVSQNETSGQSIKLNNNGTRDLNVRLSNVPYGPFEIDLGSKNQQLVVIPAGSSRNLRVSFNPDNIGAYNQSFTLTANSNFNASTQFTIKANVLPKGNSNNSFLNILHYISNPVITDANPSTKINYSTNQSANTKVDILRNGTVVKSLKSSRTTGGQEYSVIWDATNSDKEFVKNGSYTYRIKSNNNNRDKVEREGVIQVSLNKIPTNTSDAVSVTRATINPDKNELTYFNFRNTVSNLNLEIIDLKSNQVIYSESKSSISNNYQLSWDGRNFAGNKVSSGTYVYQINADQFNLSGRINVIRNKDHNSENFILYFENAPFYDQYGIAQPQAPQNETLIQGLLVAPAILTAHDASVYLSFMQEHAGPLTANVLDSNKQLIKTVIKNMPSNAGYKRNFIDWNTKINGQPAPNGQYYFELTTIRLGQVDSDIVPFTIARGPYIPQQAFEKERQRFYESYQLNQPVIQQAQINECLGFIDVEAQTEFCNAVTLAATENIFTGDQNNALRPDDFTTRAESIAILIRLLGIQPTQYNPNFDGNLGLKDLDPTQWYMPYYKTLTNLSLKQAWAKQLLAPFADGTVRPTQPVTRAEFYKSALEAIKLSKSIKSNFKLVTPKESNNFTPYEKFLKASLNDSNFARKYFGTFKLTDKTNLNLNQAVTRSEVIEFIYTLAMNQDIEFQVQN
jgi:flagellar hook assembly protein FlgD